ncbi:MAG: segregation/condensation protein A [Deferribacteres bacterium]|nr:segregation/condensation protein A [candidate division KSB1 bacterium]MCB9502252.1 segregation/condensation protein A [Deferribacteres bacterium]
MAYHVKLENFDGPLDLLLFLIKKNEVDLFNIPIAEITKQYLEYVDLINTLDLENASDYILLAATLIRIKAKMLLPKSPVEDEEEIEEDPRDELVRQLLEYQRFKEITNEMSDLEADRRLVYARRYFDYTTGEDEFVWETSGNYTLFELMSVFKEVLKRKPRITHHHVEQHPVTAEEQMAFLLAELDKHHGELLFYHMAEMLTSRIAVIVTFIAMLELIRNGKIEINQSSTFGEIWIKRRK